MYMKKTILVIVDLIEDKEFPARRNISDYIVILLQDLNVENSLVLEVEKIFNEEYEKRGEQKCFSQSEWENKLKTNPSNAGRKQSEFIK